MKEELHEENKKEEKEAELRKRSTKRRSCGSEQRRTRGRRCRQILTFLSQLHVALHLLIFSEFLMKDTNRLQSVKLLLLLLFF